MTSTPFHMLQEPIDLGDLMAAICDRLDLDPPHLAELTLTPKEATARIYLRRETDGAKYVDIATNTVACGIKKFHISTMIEETS